MSDPNTKWTSTIHDDVDSLAHEANMLVQNEDSEKHIRLMKAYAEIIRLRCGFALGEVPLELYPEKVNMTFHQHPLPEIKTRFDEPTEETDEVTSEDAQEPTVDDVIPVGEYF